MAITFGSLFAGIGGFDLGFERAGMECRWQVEIDDYASRVLAKHWPNVHRERDIRKCGPQCLQAVDVICGGFPCQPHSLAGNREGSSDERDLWDEFARVIAEMRPKVVVGENVSGLLSTESGRFFGRVLRDLAESGFDAEWFCLSASAFGAPHGRERVFLVAYSHGIRRTKGETEAFIAAKELPQKSNDLADWARTGKLIRTNRGRVRLLPESDAWRMDDGLSQSMDRLRCLGNAVVPQVAEFVGRRVVSLLTEQQ